MKNICVQFTVRTPNTLFGPYLVLDVYYIVFQYFKSQTPTNMVWSSFLSPVAGKCGVAHSHPGGGGREIITLSPPVLWKYLDIPEKTFSLSHRLFNRKHCEPSELEEPQRCPARLTPQRPLCGIPKVTISQCPILRPLHSCPLNPN